VSDVTGGRGPATTDRPPLERLLALQDEDVHADQLAHRRHHLPEQVAADSIVASLAALESSSSAARRERAELAAREEALERETGEVVARVAAIEARSRSGAASSYRDQEAMASEVGALGRRRGELEEQELEVLEASEPLDAELARVDAQRGALGQQLAAAKVALAASATQVDEEILASAARREELATVVPAGLLAEYERLRARLDGVGVARVVRGACSGCHLSLPATEVDRLRHLSEGSVAHCEQCGRILVP